MPVTVVAIPQLFNDPGAPPYPDNPRDTIFAQDWNLLRDALTLAQKGIYTKGVKLGAEGIEVTVSAPVRMADETDLLFLDGGNSNAQVGYISHDGELGMQQIRVNGKLLIAAGVIEVREGIVTHTVPVGVATNIHEYWKRDVVTVKDFEVDFQSGTLSVLQILKGDYAVDRDYAGFIFKSPSVRTIVRLNSDDELEVADVVDWAARPLTFTNIRKVMLGTDVFVDEVFGTDGVVVTEVSSNPKQLLISLSGVQAPALDIGLGVDQVGPDTLAGGGLTGDVASFVTPAERALIGTLNSAVLSILAELPSFIKVLRTATDGDILPTTLGVINLANSSSVIFDKPGDNTLRAVSSGGGGGGSVNSVTAGSGLANSGTATDPVLNVNVGDGLVIVADTVKASFAGSGVAITVARSDHNHTGVYSPVGHTHTGVYIPTGGAYADLSGAGAIGTGGGQVAAGNHNHTGVYVATGGSYADLVGAGDVGLGAGQVAPGVHLVSAHTGQLDANRVDVTSFAPVNYTPGGAQVDDHLSGIDTALGTAVTATNTKLGGQQWAGSIGTPIAPGAYLIGSLALGDTSNQAGTINFAAINTQDVLAGGTSITITVHNITAATSKVITILGGDAYKRDTALGLAVALGDQISANITAVVGIPACGNVTLRLSRA